MIKELRSKLLFILSAQRGDTIAFVGRTIDDLVRDVINPIRAAFPSGTPAVVTYRLGSTTAQILGRRVLLVATKDPRAEDRIRGATLAGCYVDEAEAIPQQLAYLLATRTQPPLNESGGV